MALLEMGPEEQTLLEQHTERQKTLAREHAALLERLGAVSQQLATAHSKYGNIHNSRVSAISLLPDQILSTIFEVLHRSQTLESSRCSTTTIRLDRGNGKRTKHGLQKRNHPTRAELTLSHVCSKWRTVALDLPWLWNVFWCDQPTTRAHLACEIERLSTYLHRSRDHDLELYFDFTWLEPEPESTASTMGFRALVSKSLSMAARHAHRWKHFSLVANDSRKVSLLQFRRELACVWAPRLERLVVCTGATAGSWVRPVEEQRFIWDPEILLLGNPSRGEGSAAAAVGDPCPSLKFLKLDNSGLAFCRPPTHHLTHLVLENGDRLTQNSHSYTIDWSTLLTSDVLRSPHLETLCISDNALDKATFPLSRIESDNSHDLNFPSLKHLCLKGTTAVYASTSSFLWFLIRWVTAPALESLTLCNLQIKESPWAIDWLISPTKNDKPSDKPQIPEVTFYSLDTLTFVNVSVRAESRSCSAFYRLSLLTASARKLVVVSSSNQASGDDVDVEQDEENTEGRLLDIMAILEQRPPHAANLPILPSGTIGPGTLWPEVLEISLNISTDPGVVSEHDALKAYMKWPRKLLKQWKGLGVVRIPPFWLDLWLSRLKRPTKTIGLYWDLPNYSWTENLDVVPDGYDSDLEEDDDDDADEKKENIAAPHRRHPIRVEPILEDPVHFWPPGSGSNRFNTLESESFDFSRSSITQTGLVSEIDY